MAFRLVPFMTDFTHLHQPFEEIKFANISQRLSASTQLAKLESSLTRYLDYISSKILRKFVAMGGLEPPSLSDWVMSPARYQLLTHRNKSVFQF